MSEDQPAALRNQRAAGISLLQVGVAVEHQPVRVWDGLHQFEHDRVEENEARLLKQAAAELPRCFDGNVKDTSRQVSPARCLAPE